MNNIISNNAYGIIGLLPNSNQKEISKRIKEIERFLQIEEIPDYPYDFNIYKQVRNLNKIKEAYHNISTIEKQILHYFFRVYSNDNKQLEILDTFNDAPLTNIIDYYHNNKHSNFIFTKNMAILSTIQLFIVNDKDILEFSLKLWYEIVNNDKTYSDFKKIFLLDDELGISDKYFEELKNNIILELTTIFSDISKMHNDNGILASFIKTFDLKSSTYDIDIVENIYGKISKALAIMDKLDISADGIFDDNEKRTLKNCLQIFQDSFNELIDLDLYENEKTIIIRDLVATKIRIQILDLFNNLDEDDVALNLMKFCLSIVGTTGLKDKLSDEIQILQKYKAPLDTINIGKRTTVTVYNKYLEINGKQVLFDEIQSVAYLLHTTRTNGIETERTYNFELGVQNHIYYLTQNLGWSSNKKQAENTFYKLLNIAEYITPILAKKFYSTLLNGKILRINNLYITKDTYYIRKWNGDKVVRISNVPSTPSKSQGNVVFYDEKGKIFYQISLNTSNAPILQALFKLLKARPDASSVTPKDFIINPSYGLHVFDPSNETEWQRRWLLFKDFMVDLFGLCIMLLIGFFILMFIIGLFGG